VIWRSTVTATYALIELIERLPSSAQPERFAPIIRDALIRIYEWMYSNSMFGYLRPSVVRYGSYLSESDRLQWMARSEELERAFQKRNRNGDRGERLFITMLGTVEVRVPHDEPYRIRGARLRVVLGLMVADRILARPLSYREFCRIAADNELDMERARKVMNMAVLRLREIVGADAIDTSGETPRLNLERVDVDLLRAHEKLQRSVAFIRDGSLMRALPLLMEVLQISGGRVPFPTLYDNFFEAAREDFETGIRNAVIRLSRELINEGDLDNAELLLRRAYDVIPDDPDFSRILVETLLSIGKRMEAERVRIQVSADD
jgi:hypothetical protein